MMKTIREMMTLRIRNMGDFDRKYMRDRMMKADANDYEQWLSEFDDEQFLVRFLAVTEMWTLSTRKL